MVHDEDAEQSVATDREDLPEIQRSGSVKVSEGEAAHDGQAGDVRTLVEQSHSLRRDGEFSSALDAAEQALAAGPGDEDALVARIAALRVLGRWEQAQERSA